MHVLQQNQPFLMDAYGMNAMFGVFAVLFLGVMALKGWALWRAARLGKQWWFIGLLVINTLGILPVIFLLMTNDEYQKWLTKKEKQVLAK